MTLENLYEGGGEGVREEGRVSKRNQGRVSKRKEGRVRGRKEGRVRGREEGREYNGIRGVRNSIVDVLNVPYMHILHIGSTSVCRGEIIAMLEKGNTR